METKDSIIKQGDVKKYIENSDCSVRATKVLLDNISTITELIEIDEKRLKSFKNCGNKTVKEILELQKKLRSESGYILLEKTQKDEPPDFTLLPDSIKKDIQFYEAIKQELSKRSQHIIIKNNIDSLEKFMALTGRELLQMRNCGRNTVAEIKAFQKKIYELIQRIKKQSDLIIPEIKNYLEFSIDDTTFINCDAPFPSLEKWISELDQKSIQSQKAFMLRMGMLGEAPMTLEQIGEKLGGLTRERIRQIIDKMEKTAKHQIRRKKLQPLVKKTIEIVNSRGGKIDNTTLVSLLLAQGSNGEMLKFATPFIDFLGTLPEWKNAGLIIDKNGIVFTDKSDEITNEFSDIIVNIAKQNADELIDENLWSIDYGFLKKLLLDWFNLKYPDRKISELSNTALDEALLQRQSEINREENRIYSYNLWAVRYGSLFKATESVLKKSGRAMHFSEIFSELTKYRPSDCLFTERNIHATLDRNQNVFLWERGTFIHKTCISIPHDLISDIEKWILKKLREDVPFIAIYGIFQVFEQLCLESNIPSEVALYSILKELSHPLIAYPRLPYIYLNNGKIERIPASLAIEQLL